MSLGKRGFAGMLVVVAIVVGAVLAAPVRAESNRKAAKEIFEKGATEYNLGHFADAIGLFEKAYALDPSPIILFNIAQCHRQTANNERALFFYRRYLAEAPKAPNRAEVEKRIADLEQSIQEQKELQKKPPPGIERDGEAPPPAKEAANAAPVDATLAAPGAAPAVTATPERPAAAAPSGPAEPRIWLSASGGLALPSLSGRNVSLPTLFAAKLSGAYIFPVATGFVDAGLLLSLTPLPYTAVDGSSNTSLLTGAFVFGRYRHRLTDALALGAGLAGGVVWWSGIGAGDPFTFQRQGADGAIPMPSFRASLEVDYRVTPALHVFGGPGYTFSKTTSPGLTMSISSISLLEITVGAGYAF
jgi:hypothetical protein